MAQSAMEQRRIDTAGRARAALLSAVIVLAALGGGLVLWSHRCAERAPELRRLASVVGTHRVTRARLTGGFEHQACRVAVPDRLLRGLVCEGPGPADWPEAPALHALARDVRVGRSVDARRDHHFAGAWKLLWGDAAAAVVDLREAARLEPASARVQSDLAAALLVLAETSQDPVALVDAFAAADSAVALDPKLAEGRFNRALALQWLHLRGDAIEAWLSYLAIDRRSPWAAEAREQLAHLEAEAPSWSDARRGLQAAFATSDTAVLLDVARKFPQQARDHVRALLTEWARRHLDAVGTPDSLAKQAALLGSALHETTGDASWADPARDVVDMLARRQNHALDAMARGLISLAEGERHYDAFDLDSAEYWFARTQQAWSGMRDLSQWAAFGLAKVAYQRHDYGSAVRRLRAVIDATPRSWLVLRGLALRTLGFVQSVLANRDAAAAAYAELLRRGDILGEPVVDLRARIDAARLAIDLRGERAAWDQVYRAFRAMAHYMGPPSSAHILYSTAAEFSWKRSPRLALLFQREAVRRTAADDQRGMMVLALTREAALLAHLGRPAEARAALRQVEEHIGAAGGNDSIEAEWRASADLVDAQVWLRYQPDSSLALLRKLVERYRHTSYHHQLSRAQLLLAHAWAATGAVDSARLAFERALAETERQRAEIDRAEDRADFLDQARPVIDSVLRFLVLQHDTIGALDFFERMRSRVLLERVHGISASPPAEAADQWRRRMPSGVNLIAFGAVDGELVTWLVRRDGIRMRRTRLDVDLAGLTERFATLAAHPTAVNELRTLAARLNDLLIEPIKDGIEPGARLVFVPDKWLHRIPFAALYDPRTSKFLVQDHEVSVAPSTQLYLEAAERFHALAAQRTSSVLAVGDPAFDAQVHDLPRLPAAQREAERVVAHYQQATLLSGTAATRRAFLAAAPASAIIHFAGHGVVRSDAPLQSHLLLAADPATTSTGALYASDIFSLHLPRTRLAILSGCHTAGGGLSYTEGVSSLARAFFAAGVPAVIASLWAVADAATAEFFAAFHEALADGADPGAALRRAQLQWLARPDGGWFSLPTWAAFQLFGATDGSASSVAAAKR
ncbi:MAG TPA: CHAT domain-containing protein [Gemmatimonadaceae bacterium]